MAGRDRREGESRLVTLLAHLLKGMHQSEYRTRSWRGTIVEQQQELESQASRGVLRNHAEAVLPKAYARAVKRALAETGLPSRRLSSRVPVHAGATAGGALAG